MSIKKAYTVGELLQERQRQAASQIERAIILLSKGISTLEDVADQVSYSKDELLDDVGLAHLVFEEAVENGLDALVKNDKGFERAIKFSTLKQWINSL